MKHVFLISQILFTCTLGFAKEKSSSSPKAGASSEHASKSKKSSENESFGERIQAMHEMLSFATRDPKFSQIASLLQTSDLVLLLAKNPNATVLLPTNEAFKNLSKQMQEDLKKPGSPMAGVLTSEILIPQRVPPTLISGSKALRIKSKNGFELAFNFWHDGIYLINQTQAKPIMVNLPSTAVNEKSVKRSPADMKSVKGKSQQPLEKTEEIYPVFYEVDSIPSMVFAQNHSLSK